MRIAVVVEARRLPFFRGVAACAALSEASFVRVVLLVAAKAFARRIDEPLVDVASGALELGVAVLQRKTRLRVVKACLFPRAFAVAGLALRAELALVRVVLAMAADARRRRVAMLGLRAMAACAPDLLVLAAQLKVGLRMVERLFVEHHDVRIATLMLGMAKVALELLETPVKARLGAHVAGHFLVAIEAALRLAAAVEPHMAVAAVGLLLDVRAADRARHDGRLEVLRGGRTGARSEEHGDGEASKSARPRHGRRPSGPACRGMGCGPRAR